MLSGGPWDPSPRKPFTPLPLFHPSPTRGRRVLGEGVLVPHGVWGGAQEVHRVSVCAVLGGRPTQQVPLPQRPPQKGFL